ncbi:MAG TPA: hypothetical protein VG168_00455 [Bryobacteraceae bacterium]|jgi:uncharacterized protein YoxC|nr:hypothetical protein [Bryobacteraceae bacterium]
MDQPTVLTIFVGICALAMLIQMITLIILAVVSKRMQDKVTVVLPEVQSVLALSKQTLQEVKKELGEFGTKTNSILDVTKGQFIKIDELLSDISVRARVQMERAEMVLDDTMSRTQKTVAIVQSGVIAPIREMHGLLEGLRAAIAHLAKGRRPTVDHATSDEEMFI